MNFGDLFSKTGPLFSSFPRFEEREGQKALAEEVAQSFLKGEIALLEAGTGIGKSFAYLVPALLLAHKERETVVVSTHTIHLQEQIVKKDLPFLIKQLRVDVVPSLVMGLQNYLCLKKLEEAEKEIGLQLDHVFEWRDSKKSLKKGDLPFAIPKELNEMLFADRESCLGQRCSHYQDCPFFKEREQAQRARILIVNHHLLLTDAKLKSRGERGILPPFSYLVLDEAHHLEEVATDLFSKTTADGDYYRIYARLWGERGVLNRLLTRIQNPPPRMREKILIEFPAVRDLAGRSVQALFLHLEALFENTEEQKWRLKPAQKQAFQNLIKPLLDQVEEKNGIILALLREIISSFKDCKDESLHSLIQEVEVLSQRIEEGLTLLKQILGQPGVPPAFVHWMSKHPKESRLGETSINPGEELRKTIFKPVKAAVLVSGTLGDKKGFSPLAKRIGLEEGGWREGVFSSPFNYQKQSLFLGLEGLPPADTASFSKEASEVLLKILEAGKGGTFLLFTSYKQLFAFKEILAKELIKRRYLPLIQGEFPRRTLLEKFQNHPRGVVFGSDSFWEGVDVPSGKLKCVVIVKLPFKSPKDPIIEARTEYLKEKGENPFLTYHLPQALIKFRQGFGRLIRNSQDRGVVICLDSRLKERGYGQTFLDVMPDCQKKWGTPSTIAKEVETFWSTPYFGSAPLK